LTCARRSVARSHGTCRAARRRRSERTSRVSQARWYVSKTRFRVSKTRLRVSKKGCALRFADKDIACHGRGRHATDKRIACPPRGCTRPLSSKCVGCRNGTRRVPPPALTGHASSLPPVLTGHALKPRGRDPGGAAAHRADAVGEARVRLVAPGRGGNGQVVRKLRTMADLALSRGAPPGPASGRNASGRGGGGGGGGCEAERLGRLGRGEGRGVPG